MTGTSPTHWQASLQPVASPRRLEGDTFLSSRPYETVGPGLQPGTQLGRFTIARNLGTGRTAHVYLAHDEVRAHDVAIKVAWLRPESASYVEQGLARELAARHRLGGHPNVLTAFDLHRFESAGLELVLLSMEYAEGRDLRAWLASNRDRMALARDEVIQIILQAAQGLAALHRAGVAHFDLKPENILCANGVWKIADLDHANVTVDPLDGKLGHEDSAVDVIRGSPGYRSPELADRTRGAVDTRADVYALGAVLGEVLDLGWQASASSTSSAGPIAASKLGRIVKCCLASDPNRRFQVVEHLIDALELARGEEPGRKKNRAWLDQQSQWRQARRCLAEGRTDDARRLCHVLLAACPHHAGARATLDSINRRREQAIAGANDLAGTMSCAPFDDAVRKLRPLVDLASDHEPVHTLIGQLEERVIACRRALVDALSLLEGGDVHRSLEALGRSAAQDVNDASAVEARLLLGDLAQWVRFSQGHIERSIRGRRYFEALGLAQQHRSRLSEAAAVARAIRENLEVRRTDREREQE